MLKVEEGSGHGLIRGPVPAFVCGKPAMIAGIGAEVLIRVFRMHSIPLFRNGVDHLNFAERSLSAFRSACCHIRDDRGSRPLLRSICQGIKEAAALFMPLKKPHADVDVT